MKATLLSFVLATLCLFGLTTQVQAQVVYESIAAGPWNSPNTWRIVSGAGSGVSLFPAPGANNIVTVRDSVALNIDYDVTGNNGLLTITADGTLVDAGRRTLTVGEQTPNPQFRLDVQPRPNRSLALDLHKINFIKAEATINADIRTASCASFSVNNEITLTSTFTINGNLVIDRGNSTINRGRGVSTAGVLIVAGRIDGYNTNQIGIFFNVLLYSVQNLIIDCNAVAPLPVELSSFEAAFGNNQVNLRWVTASEKNSESFVVERSLDGKYFETVATVRAAGTSSSRREYTAADRGMSRGVNYYRLKQTDLDGTFTYTQIIPVQVGGVEQQLDAYSDNGNLNIVMQTTGTLQTLRVMDSMGRMIYTETPTSLTTGAVTRAIPMKGISNRQVYIVQAITSEGVMNKKFSVAQ